MESERTATDGIARAVATLAWDRLSAELERSGYAMTGRLLEIALCTEIMNLYENPDGFRSRVVMARHNFGRGEYRYFDYPLPPVVAELRKALYPALATVANRWQQVLGLAGRFPATLAEYLALCHAAGQKRPTPLLLRYGIDDYNCLHQDLYGPLVFPLQVAVLLSDPRRDFTGGEFLLVEQRPRAQSRAEVVPLAQGDAVIFAVNDRPVRGARGFHRCKMRHGVSRIRSGHRFTLGLIFHDAA